MNKDFLPYPLALRMKALGFDEPCLAYWNLQTQEFNYNGQPSTFSSEDVIQLPTFSQAVRWFRNKHPKYGTHSYPRPYDETKTKWWVMWGHWTSPVFDSFEEAEIAYLTKLIETAELLNWNKIQP